MLYPGQVVVMYCDNRSQTKTEMWAAYHNDKFYQSVLGYYCTKCDLVNRGAYDKRQIGTWKADDNAKAARVPHWHK